MFITIKGKVIKLNKIIMKIKKILNSSRLKPKQQDYINSLYAILKNNKALIMAIQVLNLKGKDIIFKIINKNYKIKTKEQ